MTIADEIFGIADHLETESKSLKAESFDGPLQNLIEAAESVGRSWSGSWLGYHARVYYHGLAEPPVGARFSQEWGLKETYAINETIGNWQEYLFDEVISAINSKAGDPDLSNQEVQTARTKEVFEELQSKVLSLLSSLLEDRKNDKFFHDLVKKIEDAKIFGTNDFIEVMRPRGQLMSRDAVAIQAGIHTPPHLFVLSRVQAIRYPFSACADLSKLVRRAASHIQNVQRKTVKSERIGTNVFIGHGRSTVWKDLKDFIQDRMRLPWDEFNRVPVAGVTNIARLSQMLEEAAVAFLIMTAEDELADGKQHARQNVVHEAGLFQGRLGFEKAILLLEEGCEEFSNVQGLGQIRFPKGNVAAVFEDIRRVLEREKLVDE